MRILRCAILPAALMAVLLAGCAPASSTPEQEATAGATTDATEALVGSYSVEYRTTESDRAAITDETVVREGTVTGSCTDSECEFEFTTEVKAADGSTSSTSTALTFDGTAYHGSQASTFSCDGLATLTTVEDGLEYTSETTITPTDTVVEGGRTVVMSFEVVVVEHNEITPTGREAGCLKINFSGPDPFASNATTVGVATRHS